jgi:hypothetical protein
MAAISQEMTRQEKEGESFHDVGFKAAANETHKKSH